MPEFKASLRQPGFTYSACGRFTKHGRRIQKFKETGDLNYIYENELGKTCFAYDAAYDNSKELAKRTVSDKTLKDRSYETALDPKCDGYQRGLVSMVYKFFEKSSKEEECIQGLKIIFEQLILLKLDHYLQRIEVLNIYYVS